MKMNDIKRLYEKSLKAKWFKEAYQIGKEKIETIPDEDIKEMFSSYSSIDPIINVYLSDEEVAFVGIVDEEEDEWETITFKTDAMKERCEVLLENFNSIEYIQFDLDCIGVVTFYIKDVDYIKDSGIFGSSLRGIEANSVSVDIRFFE